MVSFTQDKHRTTLEVLFLGYHIMIMTELKATETYGVALASLILVCGTWFKMRLEVEVKVVIIFETSLSVMSK